MEHISDWRNNLTRTGARTNDSGVITDFGDAAAEGRAAGEAAVAIPLAGTGLISVTGPDASSFLNNQLTSDVAAVSSTHAQYSGYCTPKGRLVATMLLFSANDRFWLALPQELVAGIAQRLQKFVLRAKVRIDVTDASLALIGVTGPQAEAGLAQALAAPPARLLEVRCEKAISLITLPGNRFLVACPADQASAIWAALSARMRPAGWNWWQLQAIRSGIATVTAATQEAFVPQMLALDTYGGVSFTKGCYPGQEIVARTRYLGDLKRYLYYGQCGQTLAAGDSIFEHDTGSAAGIVTDAAENIEHGWEFLAVVRRDALSPGRPLRTATGNTLTGLTRAGVTVRDGS